MKIAAVLATSSGVGCTSTVANLAFALACAGRRVLVIDWGSDVPRVSEYLESFETEPVNLPDQLARSLVLVRAERPIVEADQLPVATRFGWQAASGLVDVVTPGHEAAHPGLPGAISDLRRALADSGYDDVLIDAPADSSGGSSKLIATLCDLGIVCFRPRPRAIYDAAEAAAWLGREAPVRIGLVPVATEFDERYQPRVDRIRSEIRAAFVDLLADHRPRHLGADTVEMPFRAYDTFDPLLTLLVEEPTPDNPLYAAYGHLAAAVTDGLVTAPSPVSAEFRGRYRRAFGLESALQPDRILVACAAPDRPWADWVRSRLERSGAQTRPLRRGQEWLTSARPPGLVIITSEHLEESAELAKVTKALAAAEASGAPLDVFRVLVGNQLGPEPSQPSVAVSAGSEPRLVARLLSHFGLIERPGPEPRKEPRLPGHRPEVFSVPPRNPRFIGRDDDIEELRDRLVEADGDQAVVTLSGAPGVGKSELALEYAHRFAGDYDLVWWVPAADEQSAMASLAALAATLNVPGSHNFGTTAALDRLVNDRTHSRFLLVYDNVADRAGLDRLLPKEHQGHVLITSAEVTPAELELTAMTPRDSSLLLTSRVPGLSREAAATTAAAAGHLPLALELAGTWLVQTVAGARRTGGTVAESAAWAASTFLGKLDSESGPSVGSWQEGVVSRVAAVVTADMRETPIGRIALLLAEMCSFLSSDGISLNLVRSRAMLDRLRADGGDDAQPLRLDAGEIDRVLWTGARYGLFQVAWGRENNLRMHRVVQAALRAGFTSRERAERRARMLTVLAAFAPTEVEELTPSRVARFAELQRHVFPSAAMESDDDEVRRWLVNQVHFLFAKGGQGVHRAALGPTQKLLDGWNSRYGPTDPLCLRLASQLANLYRALGDHLHAFRLNDASLATQRASMELNHPQALLTALGRGGALRGLGLFAEALEEDRATWEGFREAYGEDHPQTRKAAHNLASAMFLSGDVRGALSLAKNNYRQRLRLLGANDVSTWSPLTQVGMYQRELGDYRAAHHALHEAAQHLWRLHPALNPLSAVVRWQRAILMRCEGSTASAKQANGEALNAFREVFGPDHPNTLACQLSLATAYRAVGGEPATAVELAQAALNGYLHTVRMAEDHPFVALARLSLGLARCAAGQDGSAETHEAYQVLSGKLGDAHPWTLAAAVNHARVTSASGAVVRATELTRAARDGCNEFLGTRHPYTAVAAHNLRLVLDHGSAANEVWREVDVDVPES